MPVEQKGPSGFQIVDDEETGQGPPTEGPMTFGTLVLSLATSVLVHIGEGPSPGEQGPDAEAPEPAPVDLPLARQTIEILEMLSVKTQGNLDEDEARLLTGVLHDLRMRYVEAAGRKNE